MKKGNIIKNYFQELPVILSNYVRLNKCTSSLSFLPVACETNAHILYKLALRLKEVVFENIL
jgi:hypothetical protein